MRSWCSRLISADAPAPGFGHLPLRINTPRCVRLHTPNHAMAHLLRVLAALCTWQTAASAASVRRAEPDPSLAHSVVLNGQTFVNKVCTHMVPECFANPSLMD